MSDVMDSVLATVVSRHVIHHVALNARADYRNPGSASFVSYDVRAIGRGGTKFTLDITAADADEAAPLSVGREIRVTIEVLKTDAEMRAEATAVFRETVG